MGFFYLGLLLGWFLVLLVVARGIAWFIDARHKKSIAIVVAILGLPLPLVDEIVGAMQFSELCKNQVIYKSPNMQNMKGSRLIFIAHKEIPIHGKALPMTRGMWEYVIESDHTLMLSFAVFRAGPGYLTRKFRLNEGGTPLIFSGDCAPEEYRTLFTDYEIIN